MAEYKGIKGYSVQKVSSDPTATEVVGQLFYNSTTGAFKISVAGAGAWATGGNLNTLRSNSSGCGFGTQTAAVAAGGYASPAARDITETYNGTAWTTVPATLNTARYSSSIAVQGTNTSGLIYAGIPSGGGTNKKTEEYNGSTWSEEADMGTARQNAGYAGTETAALCYGGQPPQRDLTESWNGSAWTEMAGDLNTARSQAASGGSQTSAIYAGGTPPVMGTTEIYNGSTWSTSPASLNTARYGVAGAVTDSTNAIAFGGYAPTSSDEVTLTEKFNGTTWTEVGDLGGKRYKNGGMGTVALGMVIGDSQPPHYACEEWVDPVYTIKTVTVS